MKNRSGLEEKEIIPREPVISDSFVYLKMEMELEASYLQKEKKIRIALSDYPKLSSIIIENKNTGKELSLSEFHTLKQNRWIRSCKSHFYSSRCTDTL